VKVNSFFNIAGKIYRLRSWIEHLGLELGSGHYICNSVRLMENGEYGLIRISDENVERVIGYDDEFVKADGGIVSSDVVIAYYSE
jgi:hypothetical protein